MEARGAYRGGRGRGGDSSRPLTSTYDRRPYVPKKVVGEEAAAVETDKKDYRKPIDENSYYYRYFYDPRPKHERLEVTADTIVPPIVAKDARKKLPDQKDFDKKMKDLDTKIDTYKEKIVSLTPK